MIISEKNAPLLNAVPEFWNVDRMPEATPRCRAGTLLMIADEFGAPNMPEPMPLAVINKANAQYGKSIGSTISPTKLPPKTNMPAVANARAPNRSDRNPATGPDTRKPTVNGSRKTPAHKGVSL